MRARLAGLFAVFHEAHTRARHRPTSLVILYIAIVFYHTHIPTTTELRDTGNLLRMPRDRELSCHMRGKKRKVSARETVNRTRQSVHSKKEGFGLGESYSPS